MTVVLLTCSYAGQEFIRVGYWVNNTYGEALAEGVEAPPSPLDPSKIIRSILADRPRVTRFPWPSEGGEEAAIDGDEGKMAEQEA